ELLCRYQLRHQYLEAIKHDYETGSFGSGLADQLIEQVVNYEIKQMQQVFS
ncbi:rolling circle replication protein, Rep63 protein, partial [Acinetobacter baumannii]|nr:rolling circle replication protein, Rep63 protein [Acinetobacter baumannii]